MISFSEGGSFGEVKKGWWSANTEKAGLGGYHHSDHEPGTPCSGHQEDLGESKEVRALGLVSFIKPPKT